LPGKVLSEKVLPEKSFRNNFYPSFTDIISSKNCSQK
jgi:hypothetical protein